MTDAPRKSLPSTSTAFMEEKPQVWAKGEETDSLELDRLQESPVGLKKREETPSDLILLEGKNLFFPPLMVVPLLLLFFLRI